MKIENDGSTDLEVFERYRPRTVVQYQSSGIADETAELTKR